MELHVGELYTILAASLAYGLPPLFIWKAYRKQVLRKRESRVSRPTSPEVYKEESYSVITTKYFNFTYYDKTEINPLLYVYEGVYVEIFFDKLTKMYRHTVSYNGRYVGNYQGKTSLEEYHNGFNSSDHYDALGRLLKPCRESTGYRMETSNFLM